MSEENATQLPLMNGLAVFLMAVWWAFDFFFLKEHAQTFLVYRAACLVVTTALVASPLRRSRNPTTIWLLTSGMLLAWATAVAWMLPHSGKYVTFYALGLSVIALAAGVLPIWPRRWVASTVLAIGLLEAAGLYFYPDLSGRVIVEALALYFSLGLGALLSATGLQRWFPRSFRRTLKLEHADLINKRVNAERREAERNQQRVFHNVSHELRTPLTTLSAALDNLTAGEPLPTKTHTLMSRNILRITRQVDDILHLAQSEGGSLKLHPTRLDGAAEAARVCEMLSIGAEAKGIRLRFEPHQASCFIKADKYHLETILTNLVSNAIKYTPDNGRILVRVFPDAANVRFEVSDTGIGIPKEKHDAVFTRFEQVGERQAGGVGIGLSLARELVVLHGGELALRSSPGRGSTFWFTIPATAEQPASAVSSPSSAPPKQPRGRALPLSIPPAHADDGTRCTVLLVDDEDDVRAVVRDTLCSEWNVLEARDGLEGVAKARKHRPDVIVTDMQMPRCDGAGLISEVRADPVISHTPVICLTARNSVDAETAILAVGADDYISKPFSPDVLKARVRLQLRLRALVARVATHERLVAVGTFAGGILHEVNNPASRIIAAASLVAPNMTEKQLSTARTTIEESARRIVSLTTALRTHATPEETEQSRPFALLPGLESTIRLLDASYRSSTKVTLDCPPEVEAFGVPSVLNHVLLTLLENSRKSGASTVHIRVTSEPRYVAMEVQDNGPGIPDKLRERVFDPFFTLRPVGDGAGLGLFVCRSNLTRIGAAIDAAPCSTGARMVVRIPTQPTAAPAVTMPAQGQRPSSTPPPP